MSGRTNFPGVKAAGDDSPEQRAKVTNQILLGKINCTLAVTLRANQTTTTVEDPRIYETSLFVLDPRTAAAKLAQYGAYVSSVSKGSVTITHSSAAATNQDFILGILS